MAMNKQRKTSNLANIVTYDAFGNVVLPAGLQVQSFTSGYVTSDASGVLSIAPAPTSANIYNTNGTLTSNRTVTLGSYTLSFTDDIYVNSVRIGKGNGSFSSNTAIGVDALLNFNGTTFGSNTAIGFSALKSNTTGYQNTAIGPGAMFSTTTANSNVAIGISAMYFNTTGGACIAIGARALQNSNVNYNVAIGADSLYLTTSGPNNTAIGSLSGREITTGQANTVIGYQAGRGITTGSYNTIIGVVSGLSATLANNIIIADGSGNQRLVFNSSGDAVFGSSAYPTFAGFKLDVLGTTRFSGSVTSGGTIGIAHYYTPTLTASANSDTLVGVDVNPTFSTGAYTGVTKYGLRTRNIWLYHDSFNTDVSPVIFVGDNTYPIFTINPDISDTEIFLRGNNPSFGNNWWLKVRSGYDVTFDTGSYTGNMYFNMGGTNAITIKQNRNIIVGGSTDDGFKFDVQGTSRVSSSFGVGVTSISSSAIIQADSTTKGILPPRMTSTQISGISSPAVGLLAYQTNGTEGLYEYTSSGWRLIHGSTSSGTVTSVGLTAGSGISVSGGPITTSGSITVTNSAPDQVVTLTNGGGMSITGTYPNFTLQATASVSGTAYYVPSFNGSGTGLIDSAIYYDTAHVMIGTTTSSGSVFEVTSASTNDIATFSGVEPYIWIKALGGSNGAALFFSPSSGINGSIHNRTGGGIETYVGSTPSVKHVVKASGQIQFNGYTSTGSFSGTAAGYLGFDSSGNIITTTGVGGITLTTTGSSGAATWDGTTLNIPIYSGGGGGSVTNVSVVSANGFAGTVANATSTPAITLTTTVTGILKGNSTSISAASAGLDYQAPITVTTTGSSGAATFAGNILNIPNYGLLSGINIYGSDGTLTGNRLVSSGGYSLTIEPLTYFLNNISVSKNQNNPTAITLTNTTSALQSRVGVIMTSDGLAGSGYLYKYSSGATGGTGYSWQNDLVLINNTAGNIVISNLSGGINFFTGGANQYMTLTSAGKLLLGTASAGGSKLRISGLPTSSAGLVSGDVWSNGGVLTIVP